MDLRALSDTYSSSAQLQPDDMATLAAQGYTTIICNRPDAENPPDLQAAAMQAAAEAAGLVFVFNPVIATGIPPAAIDEQADAMEASDGPVVAYCASGMRSSLLWSLTMSGQMPTDEILDRVRAAGFPLDHLHGQIEGVGARRSDKS